MQAGAAHTQKKNCTSLLSNIVLQQVFELQVLFLQCLSGVLKDMFDKRQLKIVRSAGTNVALVLADRLDVIHQLTGGVVSLVRASRFPPRETGQAADLPGPDGTVLAVLLVSCF